jgi:hypothetical protein
LKLFIFKLLKPHIQHWEQVTFSFGLTPSLLMKARNVCRTAINKLPPELNSMPAEHSLAGAQPPSGGLKQQ